MAEECTFVDPDIHATDCLCKDCIHMDCICEAHDDPEHDIYCDCDED